MNYRKIIRVLCAATILATSFVTAKEVFAFPKGIDVDTKCTVADSWDDESSMSNKGSTFKTALKYANKPLNDTKVACKKGINITVDLNLGSPKEIIIPSAPSATGSYYEIKGVKTGGKVVIDASSIPAVSDDALQSSCAITIKGHNIKLSNIEIRNSPAIGLCIESSEVYLENVDVTYSGYHAIKIGEMASRVRIDAKSMVKEVGPGGYGVYIAASDNPYSGMYSNNMIEGTDSPLAADVFTDEYGTAIFAKGDGKEKVKNHNFEITGLGLNAFYSNSDSRIVLSFLQREADAEGNLVEIYDVEGGVTRKSYGPDQACLFESFLPEVTKIHVYGTVKSALGFKTRFLTYVTDYSKCAEGVMMDENGNSTGESTPCEYGLIADGYDAGRFAFRFDPFRYGANGVQQLVLIPEFKGESLGAPRVVNLIDLTIKGQEMLECPYWTPNPQAFASSGAQSSTPAGTGSAFPEQQPAASGGSSSEGGSGAAGMEGAKAFGFGGGSGGSGGGQQGGGVPEGSMTWIAFKSIQQCIAAKGAKANEKLRDSDRDGIPDYVEYGSFKNQPAEKKCLCHEGELCWYLPDSDFDGIPDGAEPKEKAEDINEHSCGVMGKNDCDNDGTKDGEEDRSRIFNPDRNAYLYLFNYLGGQTPYKPFGQLIQCTLDVGGERELGVSYKWYVLGNGDPQPYSFEKLSGNEAVELLVCRNSSVSYQTNFNGKCDSGRGESRISPVEPGAENCPDKQSDLCTVDTTTGKEKCNISCIEGEVIQAIDLDYVVLEESTGMPLKLKDENKNSTPDLFELDWKLIASKCSDLDHDSIPDCVERWDGKCGGKPGQQVGFLLDPYTDDTDNDGFVDGPANATAGGNKVPDVCPATMGADDNQVKDHTKWSCSARNSVYNTSPNGVLACFLDRDGDGLRDCEEDVNKDGDASVDGKESDPLNPDEDNDGLGDYVERKYGTHPYKTDTDKDDLSDCVEICGDEANCPDMSAKNQAEKKIIIDECVLDVRTDAVKGCFEVSGDGVDGLCKVNNNPAQQKLDDADEAGLSEEEQFKNVVGKMRCYGDTDPLDDDTDGDDISDGLEVKVVGTNPLNKDSDGDDLRDDSEDTNANGIWPVFENGKVKTVEKGNQSILEDFKDTNPCDTDTDEDGFQDSDISEAFPCASNPERSCQANENSQGMDADNDGLADIYEDDFNTTLGDADSDNDHVKDGDELWWHVINNDWSSKTFLPQEGESDPALCVLETEDDQMTYSAASVGGITIYYLKSLVGTEAAGTTSLCKVQISKACGTDSDGDGMPDNAEYKYGTNPGVVDTDGDGIIDGVEAGWLIAETVDLKAQTYRLRQNTGQYTYTPGSNFTNALDTDTDKDGLTDGFTASTNFEDKNCNGRPDTDQLGRPLELDPRNANSDGDKWTDKEEFCWNGICGAQAAIGRALSGQREGCANIGGAGGETWGMTLMFVMMLAATRVTVIVMKRTRRVKAQRR